MPGGHNHHSGCSCPWCLHVAAMPINFKLATVSSFVNPNAHCPVCDEPVFYYRSPFNGRVFFDRLGKPWPKHPCTDNNKAVRQYRRLDSDKQTEFEFTRSCKESGWTPFSFIQFEKPNEKGIRFLAGRELLGSRIFYFDALNIPDEVENEPAFIRQDASGEWEIDTPRGTFSVKIHPINPNPSWRRK